MIKLNNNPHLIVILGAGASLPAGIPTMDNFVEHFEQEIASSGKRWQALVETLREIRRAWENTKVLEEFDAANNNFDLEKLYEILFLINRSQRRYPYCFSPLRIHLADDFPEWGRETEVLEFELKKFIQKRCLINKPTRVNYLRPLLELSKLHKPLRIFTFNYDTCIETLCERYGIKWTDGFEGKNEDSYWNPVALDIDGDYLIKLFKLHGSATWYEVVPSEYRRFLHANQRQLGSRLGKARTMTLEGMIIYPGIGKQVMSSTFLDLFARFRQILQQTRVCIAIGYRFADQHICDIVIEALRKNQELVIALVNPQADTIAVTLLAKGKNTIDSSRIIPISGTQGYVETALQKEWLFNRANAWFMGNFSREESSATENAHKSLVPKYAKRSINMVGNLKQRLFGVAVESDGTKAYVTTEAGELWFVDLQTEIWHLLIHDLKRPRGIAIESDRNVLYAVMNQYDAPKSRWREKPFENKEGLGRLWKVNLQTGDRIPLTGLMKVQEKLSSPSAHANYLEGWGWKAPPGILRWPVSVAIEKSRESLLVTQARAICRVNIKTSTIEYPISIPLCSNLYDLAIEKSGTVLALESGVWGEFSYGRLLRLDLVSGNLKQLGAGWPLTTGIASLPSEKRVLIAQQFPFPFGRIFEYNVDSSTRYIMREWIGLDSPTQVAIPSDSSFALITTHRGLYRIDL